MLNTYIVFLRAVNVSGKNSIKMAELKSRLETYGFQQVKTYIQSGNVILQSEWDKEAIQLKIKNLIKHKFQLDIHVFVLSENELKSVIENNPFPTTYLPNKVFITLLNKNPHDEYVGKFEKLDLGEEQYHINANILYFYVPDGMANSKLSNPLIENKLKIIGTGRNLNTMNKILELVINTK